MVTKTLFKNKQLLSREFYQVQGSMVSPAVF